MDQDFFFGYGSLVNLRTHDNRPAFPATARGWRRAWVATTARQVAFLTAVPDPNTEIQGLIAVVPPAGWAALDAREAEYERIDASGRVEHHLQSARQIVIYEIAPENRLPPSSEHPILLSYLDVVIQGYLAEFGEDGARRFFDTTSGWESPILNDRKNPQYPRTQELSPNEIDFVDTQLAAIGASILR